MEKKKILVISDHPLMPSGVGIQTKYLIEGLLETGKYKFVVLGGAIKHPSYEPQKVAPEKYGDDGWLIYPVDGHGNKEIVRKAIDELKPDAMWIMQDPRFYVWLWEIEDEIRSVCPLLYWHVWDNDPPPDFNMPFYKSNDHIGCISLKTYGILHSLGYENCSYIPHALPDDLFKPLSDEEIKEFRRENFGPFADREFIVMWNNRNARRKQTGDVIVSFSRFMKKVGKDNVALLMHTAPDDQEGQDIHAVAKKFGVDKNLIMSDKKVAPEIMNKYYNSVDCTLSISSNEGFGLSTLESMYSGTPIIVHATGGLQYQLGEWWKDLIKKPEVFCDQHKMNNIMKDKKSKARWSGIPIFSASRSCTGSQQIPYIYDDRVNHYNVEQALVKMYKMSKSEREQMSRYARDFAITEFSMGKMIDGWDRAITDTINNFSPVSYRIAVV